ncbi:MAG TPA: LytTR family DNA-binding domain-containing protein [Steroidobacteraceae bacterium]|nr:LytTR family DNA-binding domain-containing protein [Steroidobacteraceae bacterium]
MITALIAEDEVPQRAELCSLLSELWPDLTVISECDDGLSALEAMVAHRPQVAFLDIRMPGVSGLEVAKAAAGNTQIVFVTAYEEYALQAFDRGAVDYLLKPIKRDRLEIAIARVRERLAGGIAPDLTNIITALEQQLSQVRRQGGIKWITATIGNATKMFSIDEVLFFQAQDKYTRVVTATDEAFIRTTLKELAVGLDSDVFWQIHRSAIVRAGIIQSVVRSDDGKLVLRLRGKDGMLPVSSAFQYRFRSM